MELISSYGIEIKRLGKKMLLPTITIYNQAVSFCVEVFEKEWANIDCIKDTMKQKAYAEKLIHSTKTIRLNMISITDFIKCLLI